MPPLALLAFLALLGPRGPNIVVSAQLCKELEEEGNLLLNETDLATIKASLVRILRRDRDKQGTFLRLAFHDCATGCNGCLDLDDVKNGGLDKSVAELEGLWEQLRPFLSGDLHFGDLLYLSGAVAVEEGVKVNNELCPSSSITCTMLPEIEVPFKQGRRFVRSWDSFPEPEHGGIGLDNDGKGTLPGPLLINQNLLDYFDQVLDLDELHSVAIMGAHTMGRCNQAVIGSPHAFNNEYFQHLIRVEGEHYRPHLGLRVNRQDKKTVWEDSDGLVLLMTDMSLVKRLELTRNKTVDSLQPEEGDPEEIATASAAGIVRQFASDGAAFLSAFLSAYERVGEAKPKRDAARALREVLPARENEQLGAGADTHDTGHESGGNDSKDNDTETADNGLGAQPQETTEDEEEEHEPSEDGAVYFGMYGNYDMYGGAFFGEEQGEEEDFEYNPITNFITYNNRKKKAE